MGSILKMEHICKNFAGLKALDDISLDIQDDEIFGLIGPNGAGKTTLFNAVSGFSAPSSGEVYFCGENFTDKTTTDYCIKGLARTFQNIRVFGDMTVVENLKVGMHKNITTSLMDVVFHTKKMKEEEEKGRKKCQEIMEFLGIEQHANEFAASLPYGTQRLIEIGRALASDPKLILLDEPSAGMNEQETMELAGLIRKIRKSGPAVLVIEHNMKFMMGLCDRIACICFGKLLAIGTPDEVQNNTAVIEAYLGKEDAE